MSALQIMTASSAVSKDGQFLAEVDSKKQSKAESLQGMFSNYMKQSQAGNPGLASDSNAGLAETAKKTSDVKASSVKQEYDQYQSRTVKTKEVKQTNGAEKGSQMTENLEEAAETVKNIIEEELDLAVGELEEAMELLGLTELDLLNPQNLMQLTLELTGAADRSQILFSESFQNVFQQVNAISADLLDQLGMSMEELVSFIDQQKPEEAAFSQILGDQPQSDMEAAMEQTGQTTETPVHVIPSASQQAGADFVQNPQEAGNQERTEEVQVQTVLSQADQENRLSEKGPQEAAPEGPLENTREEDQKPLVVSETGTEPEEDQTDREETEAQDQLSKARQLPDQDTSRHSFHTDFSFQVHITHSRAETPQVQQPLQTNQAPLPQVNVPSVMQQIVEYTRVNLTQAVKSIEMQLNPENLGKIYLHISEKEGAVTAQIAAQNENMKDLLTQQAVALKESLNQQGVKVDAVEVSVGTHEFEESLERDAHQQEERARQEEESAGHRKGQRRSLDLNNLDQLSGLMTEEEALAAQIMRDNGNNLDYRA